MACLIDRSVHLKNHKEWISRSFFRICQAINVTLLLLQHDESWTVYQISSVQVMEKTLIWVVVLTVYSAAWSTANTVAASQHFVKVSNQYW